MSTTWNTETMVPAAIDRHRAELAARKATPAPPPADPTPPPETEPPEGRRARRPARPITDTEPAPAGADEPEEATP